MRENTRASGKAARAFDLASPLACQSRVTSNDIAQMESSLAGLLFFESKLGNLNIETAYKGSSGARENEILSGRNSAYNEIVIP